LRRKSPAHPEKDSNGPPQHLRLLSLLPLSALLGAGVFSGLDSNPSNQSSDHPPALKRGGFLIFSLNISSLGHETKEEQAMSDQVPMPGNTQSLIPVP
jgi:hypothetical protein